jgi:hypothetical protein
MRSVFIHMYTSLKTNWKEGRMPIKATHNATRSIWQFIEIRSSVNATYFMSRLVCISCPYVYMESYVISTGALTYVYR